MALAGSIADYASAVRVDARVGPFANHGMVTAAPAGIALVERGAATTYRWDDVASVRARRGGIEIVTAIEGERRVHRFSPMIDGVPEPSLVPTLARVLEDMRRSRFTFNGTAWLEHQNRTEHLRSEFADQDEPVVATVAAGVWLAIGLVLTLILPVALNAAEVRAVPPGAFVLRDRIGSLDPRTLMASFALAALATMGVLRLSLGPQAVVWARGAARGWKRGRRGARLVFLLFGRMLLGTSSAAIFALLALLTFWPNLAATVYLDPSGVRSAVLLPFISIDERWPGAAAVDAGSGVVIRFPNGRTLATAGRELGGGTSQQLIEYVRRWSGQPG